MRFCGWTLSVTVTADLPSADIDTRLPAWTRWIKGVAVGSGIMDDHFTQIGYRHGWGKEIPFGISAADQRHHLYLIGKTGSGKTTLLRNLINPAHRRRLRRRIHRPARSPPSGAQRRLAL